MTNKIQPRPGDGADEETIEKNLKEMEYDPKEDVMQHGEEVNTHPVSTNKQESTTEQLKEE